MRKQSIVLMIVLMTFLIILSVGIAGCSSQAPPATANTSGLPSTPPVTLSQPPVTNNTPNPTAIPDPGFETKGSLDKMYYYIVDGTPGYISLNVYTGVNDYIESLGDIYTTPISSTQSVKTIPTPTSEQTLTPYEQCAAALEAKQKCDNPITVQDKEYCTYWGNRYLTVCNKSSSISRKSQSSSTNIPAPIETLTSSPYNEVIDNEVQRQYISPMVEEIQLAAKNPDDEARIAISLVQHIKYDPNALNEFQYNTSKTNQAYIGRYPYTILYQNWGGICGEKSFLLALLLKELGYGVALFEFDDIHHMAVGVKAPAEYSFKGTGYAIIESTAPIIPTFDEFSFVGTGATLSSSNYPKTVVISDGRSFTTIGTEYSDAQLESSIFGELDGVNSAAANVNAILQQLEQLRAEADYWMNQARIDSARGDTRSYQNDLTMYNQAIAAYENGIQSYNYAWVAWDNMKAEYLNNFAPKQKGLEDKYGLTTGISVGL